MSKPFSTQKLIRYGSNNAQPIKNKTPDSTNRPDTWMDAEL